MGPQFFKCEKKHPVKARLFDQLPFSLESPNIVRFFFEVSHFKPLPDFALLPVLNLLHMLDHPHFTQS